MASYAISVREHGDFIIATAEVRINRDVWLTIRSKVSQNAIKDLLGKTFKGHIPHTGPDVSGFFGKLWKGVKGVAKKVAKSKVIKGAFKAVKGVVKSPIFQGALTAIPGVGPVLGPGLAMATAAYSGLKAGTAKRAGNKKKARAYAKHAKAVAKRARLPYGKLKQSFRYGMDQSLDPRAWQMMVYGARMFGRKVHPFGSPQYPMPYAQQMPRLPYPMH